MINRLIVKEALLISQHTPIINKQFENFVHTLKLFKNTIHPEPSLPPALYNSSTRPSQVRSNPSPSLTPTPIRSQSNSSIVSPNSTLSTPRRLVSPNINNRINLLLQQSRLQISNNNSHDPPRSSPPRLRPRVNINYSE